jgi:hypothetical protein
MSRSCTKDLMSSAVFGFSATAMGLLGGRGSAAF